MNLPGLHKAISPVAEKWLVFASLITFCTISITYGFLSHATWDDDCPTRYFNTLNAFSNPSAFIDLWNRPLFVIIFAVPVQLSKYSIAVLMTLIVAASANALYKALKEQGNTYAFMVVPFLLFQAFFFGISRNAETEPLAAALICFGFLCMVRRKFLWFAILGGLLPLARLELGVLLIFWLAVLWKNKQLKLAPVLLVPVFVWNLIGAVQSGDALWLLHQAIGDNANRYGEQSFGHYFQRYIYVLGPLVFYFFLVGFIRALMTKRNDVFVLWQFVTGFLLYVLLSWKLSMGDAAGFLRNLLPLSPFAAIFATEGFALLMRSVRKETAAEEAPAPPKEKKNKNRKNDKTAEQKPAAQKVTPATTSEQRQPVFIIAVSLVLLATTWMFFSYQMEVHHHLTTTLNYTNLAVIVALSLLAIGMITVAPALAQRLEKAMIVTVVAGTIAFAAITEKLDSHSNPERDVMEQVAALYNSGFSDTPVLVNHIWFYWSGGLNRTDKRFGSVQQSAIDDAEESSLVIWEPHYSARLGGDVTYEALANNPQFIELFRITDPENKFFAVVFQKTKPDAASILAKYDKAIALFPDLASVYVNRAAVRLNRLNDREGSMQDYEHALSLDPENAVAYFGKGLILYYLKAYPASSEAFLRSAELDPKNADAYYNRGLALFEDKKIPEAISSYSQALSIDGQMYGAYLNRARAYVAIGDTAKALQDHNMMIQVSPNNPQAYCSRGMFLCQTKDFSNAYRDFEAALSIQPSFAQAYFYEGMMLVETNHRDEACAKFQKAIDLGYAPAQAVMLQFCQ